ncbi:hypothetical protein BLNAU_17545 [Blattamonas nauphoetae]|uniref:Protein kinase domain-containing protein n=1 Tax=Blattamonas nauphoetae TaxID=2049346 RepID=A0ABQ9X6W8_9EUKA|nr:hypothetical protein BLNAU_17545 [Blattamonas nauphoetae]
MQYWGTNNANRMDVDCPNSSILRLNEEVVISSSFEIRSEELTLIGNSSRLLFQRDIQRSSASSSWSPNPVSTTNDPGRTPKVENDGLSAAGFMFDVLNSTFSVSGVHAILNSKRKGICSVAGSTVRFSSSWITSNGDSCPFMVRTSGNEETPLGSTIILADLTHHSMSGHVAPFVGLIHPQQPLLTPRAIERGDGVTGQADIISIVGTGLLLESKDLIGTTGPLFSFGVLERNSSLGASRCGLRLETNLVGSTLLNVSSSSSPIAPNKPLFGSEVSQRVVGCSMSRSMNHDSGTAMMSPNLGGNFMCLNTSFSSCIRLGNEDLTFSFENRTQWGHGRLDSVPAGVTSVTFTLCTFRSMYLHDDSSEGGAAICLSQSQSSLSIDTCSFSGCQCYKYDMNGGAIFFTSDDPAVTFSLTHSSFTDCYMYGDSGSIVARDVAVLSIDSCFFAHSEADRHGAAEFVSDTVSISNTAFVDCSAHEEDRGAICITFHETLSLLFLQFRHTTVDYEGDARDIYFTNPTTQITADMVQFCDSTSGDPNVYLWQGLFGGPLVPQIDQTPTVESVTVTFENNEAIVRVETKEAIRGTLNILLEGPNVPRLVHVLFGDRRTLSTVGTVVVSSGPNGILPEATYQYYKSSLAPYPAPTVRSAESIQCAWDKTEIVMKGVYLLDEGNITLQGWLEWETEYKDAKVMWIPEGKQEDEELTLVGFVTLITPAEPPRFPNVTNRMLNADRTEVVVSLEGRKLRADLGYLILHSDSQYWQSIGEIDVVNETHCSASFKTAKVENSTHVEFGKAYELYAISSDWIGNHVETGIIIEVPLPPKITFIEFIFSNALHSGCIVVLTGTDLIVGNSLNVTLNNSLSLIATVTSEIEAKSVEVQIGWPTTLQHNTEYAITSIETMNDNGGSVGFDPPIANTTGSLPTDIVIFVDSGSSSESSLFCGDRERPCCSIEDGWKIVEGSSELEGEGMIEVVGGRLWIHDVDVVLSDSPSLIFIRMVGGHLTMKTCSLVGPKGTPPSNIIESSATLCEWDSGILMLLNSTTIIKQTDMTYLSQGAINMKNGSLSIETSAFHDNTPPSSSFPSLRHNIRCSEGGEIDVGSLNGGDGMETPSAWISASDCQLTAKEAISRSPFFVPTLSSSSTSTLNKSEKAFDLTMKGTTLIPCSLILEVFEKKKDGSAGLATPFLLTQNDTIHFNDTTIILSLLLSSLSSLDDSLEWRGRLRFGNDQLTETSFLIQENAVERRSQAVKENMKWWLPLVISLSVLFVIVVVVVLVCCRRRRVERTGQKETEMKESDQLQMEDEKIEIVTDNRIGVNSVHTFSSSQSDKETDEKQPEPSEDLNPFENVEEVLVCSGDLKTTDFVSKDRTLYNALHSEKKWDVRIRQAQQQLVGGLKGVWKKDRQAAILRALTAHNILFDSKQNVCLKLNLDLPPHTHLPLSTQQNKTEEAPQEQEPAVETNESKLTGPDFAERVNEGVRWFAPEVISNKSNVNCGHGAVFSLGLILWEMETGLVPFGEHDAVNASRQIVTGVQPKLELVKNDEMRELISQCLSLKPVDRPDLETIKTTLDFIPADKSFNPNALAQC